MAQRFTSDHLRQAIALQEKFWTQAKIAAHLGFSRKTINQALTRYNRRVLRRLAGAGAALKGRQLAQLEWMASQAIQEWERSKLRYESVTTREGRPGGVTRVETTTHDQTGNVAYLAEARALMAEQRRILGIDADGTEITPEDVRQLLDVLARAVGVERHPALLRALNQVLGESEDAA